MLVYNTTAAPLGGVGNKTECSKQYVRSLQVCTKYMFIRTVMRAVLRACLAGKFNQGPHEGSLPMQNGNTCARL